MGLIYTRTTDGTLEQVKTIRVINEQNGEGLDTTIHEFNQMNDVVQEYLNASAVYDDDAYDGVSVIKTDTNTEGTISPDYNLKDRPVPYSTSSQKGTFYLQYEEDGYGYNDSVTGTTYNIYNTVPNKVSQFLIKKSDGTLANNGRIKSSGKVRMINFAFNAKNCRDLGGWECDGNGTVKYDKIFRCGSINHNDNDNYQSLIDKDKAIAKSLNIKHHIDIRNEKSYTESLLGSDIRFHHIPIGDDSQKYYEYFLKPSNQSYANFVKILHTIFDAAIYNEKVIYHCSLGRDRTGTVAFMILALLGVSKTDIDRDYELSSFSSVSNYEQKTYPTIRSALNGMNTYLSTTFNCTTLRDNVIKWFISAGFTYDELNAFRSAMIDGTPDILAESTEGEPVNYQIVNNLTNCATSNTETYTTSGSPYTTTLTFTNDRNTFSSVSVIMNNIDVTTNVYNNGVITIPSVTGDVTITAVAIKNWIPVSTDADGSIFNNTGWKANARLNGSGNVEDKDNIYITGFIPCKSGDVIRFRNMNLDTTTDVMDGVRLAFYNADKSVIDIGSGSYASVYWKTFLDKEGTEISTDDILQSIVVPTYSSEVYYARFGSYTINNNSIITVNEEIV